MLLGLIAVGLVAAAEPSDPCAAAAGHRGFTILLGANGQFHHCRHGESTDAEPMSKERVVLQLPAEDPAEPYRYRFFNPATQGGHPHHQLLKAQLQTIRQYEAALHDLANSTEGLQTTIDRLPTAAEPTPPSPAPLTAATPPKAGEHPAAVENPEELQADAAEARYLSHATPAFRDALHRIRKLGGAFDEATSSIEIACGLSAEHVRAGLLRERVTRLCADGGPAARMRPVVATFRSDLGAFIEARTVMKDLVVDGRVLANSVDPGAIRKATAALNAASAAAVKVVAGAGDAATAVGQLASDVAFLRAAISIPASEEGVRVQLGRFSAGGWFTTPDIYQVHVVREPSRLFALTEAAPSSTPETRELLVDRFQPVPRNFLSLGVSVLYTTGLPDHPELIGHKTTLTKVRTQGFVGGVEVSLKPLEFTHLPDPVASLLHFPVVVIPFTENPLSNYFIGAGVGWEGLGSLDVGVHVAETTVPAPGDPYGAQFTPTTQLSQVTAPGPVSAGFFVGLTLDVLGVVETIVALRHPTVRDVGTGNAAP